MITTRPVRIFYLIVFSASASFANDICSRTRDSHHVSLLYNLCATQNGVLHIVVTALSTRAKLRPRLLSTRRVYVTTFSSFSSSSSIPFPPTRIPTVYRPRTFNHFLRKAGEQIVNYCVMLRGFDIMCIFV